MTGVYRGILRNLDDPTRSVGIVAELELQGKSPLRAAEAPGGKDPQ